MTSDELKLEPKEVIQYTVDATPNWFAFLCCPDPLANKYHIALV